MFSDRHIAAIKWARSGYLVHISLNPSGPFYVQVETFAEHWFSKKSSALHSHCYLLLKEKNTYSTYCSSTVVLIHNVFLILVYRNY